VYVLLGRAVTEYRWGGSRNSPFMRHKFLVLTMKKRLKSVYIYGSYRKIKTGVSLFLDHSVHNNCKHRPTWSGPRKSDAWGPALAMSHVQRAKTIPHKLSWLPKTQSVTRSVFVTNHSFSSQQNNQTPNKLMSPEMANSYTHKQRFPVQ